MHKTMVLDEAESARLDKVVETDSKQIRLAQLGTIILNLALIIGAVVLGLFDKTVVAGALIGGLAVINAMTLYVGGKTGERDRGDE